MSQAINEKYEGEKDLISPMKIVPVARSYDADNDSKDLNHAESDSDEIKSDLRLTEEELADAEEYAKNLTIEDVRRILKATLAVHEHDPNFPVAAIDKAKRFLYDEDVARNPDRYSSLYHEMFLEAALMDNHSPYAEVRAVVSNKDDPSLPSSTVRVWVLGLAFVVLGAFVNQLFDIRQPRILIEANVAQLLIYPVGCAWAKWMPDVGVSVFGNRISLNPDRHFNQKEHMLATIMANTGFSTPYTSNIILTQFLPQYYNQAYAASFAYQILITLGTNFVGYGMAGVIRRFLVNPAYAVWPTSLVTIALNKALHRDNDKTAVLGPFGRYFRASRMKCFSMAFAAMFAYFWLPNYIFGALATFNWMSWIAPDNQVYNNIVGTVNGLGYNPIPTFDWNYIVLFGDPLVLPAFNIINATIGMFLTGFMILGIYYSNAWYTAYLPINSNRTFNRFGTAYNILNVTDSRGIFDQQKYEAYSPAYMSAGNITVYFWFFAAYAAVVSYAFLYHRNEIKMGVKGIFKRGGRMAGFTDVHNRLMSVYPDVGEIWYFAVLCFAILCGCLGIGLWETYTTPAVVIYGVILCAFCVVPIGIIKSITGLEVTMNVLAEFIGGSWVAGNALAMNYFKSFGYITTAQALAFSNDLKLGHYLKIPPRHTFLAQLAATVVSSFVCVGVFNFQMNNINGICTPGAAFRMTCPGINTFFTASVFWGTLGPHRMFGPNGQYTLTLIGFPVGFMLPIAFYYAKKKFPRYTWLRQIHPIPLIYGGISWAPYNFSYQWPALPISLFSMLYLKKRFLAFWSRYNYTVSAAFSTGIALSGILIFFAVQLPEKNIEWWGNEVSYVGCEGAACTPLEIPTSGFGPGIGQFS